MGTEDARQVTTAIAALTQALCGSQDSALPRSILELHPDASEERVAKRQLSDLVRRTTVLKRFSHGHEFGFKDVDALYGEAVSAGSPEYVLDALNYLRLYQALATRLRAMSLEEEKWFDTRLLRDAAPDLIAAVEAMGGFEPGLLSSRLILGKLHALHTREAAFDHFAAAQALSPANPDLFEHDGGASTYFDRKSLERETAAIDERRASLPPRQSYGLVGVDGVRHLCLVSCERRFLGIYLPYWLSIAQYLEPRGFGYHFLITAPAAEAAGMVESAEAMLRALAKLRGADPAGFGRNISFSSVPVPSWCADERTYSACARYLYARDLSEETGTRVLIQDIDLVISHDPVVWFDAMPQERIVLGSYSPDLSLDPWRKFSAGLFGLPYDEAAFELMRAIEDYVLAGLAVAGAWYLDQNALAYFHDIATREGRATEELLFSLDDQKAGLPRVPGGLRPIHSLPVHGLFERSA